MKYVPDSIHEIAKVANEDNWQLYAQQLIDDIKHNPGIYNQILSETRPNFANTNIFAFFQSLLYYFGNIYKLQMPSWIFKPTYLSKPWFPSGIENLKAMCMLESPIEFKRNNIFILKNFLERI